MISSSKFALHTAGICSELSFELFQGRVGWSALNWCGCCILEVGSVVVDGAKGHGC